MSGIAGILRFNGRPLEAQDVERILDRMPHRGVDAVGVWNRGGVGLGHRLLCTLPEDVGASFPLVVSDGEWVVTADIRLDNREALIVALGLGDRDPGSMTDTYLLLAAYQKWGEHCPEHLLGDFAFAVWDERRKVLFCARDHMGLKPFCYFRSRDVFVFASEIKGLWGVPEVPEQVNDHEIAAYLANIFPDKSATFFNDIFRLPSAHCLTISDSGFQLRRYWEPAPSPDVKPASDAEYAEQFRAIFTEAVRCRLRSAFPIGSMLSGGLDSSSVTCVARDLLQVAGNTPLPAFSAVMPDSPQSDESEFINAVLATGGIEPHFMRADQMSPLYDKDRLMTYLDVPNHGPNGFYNWGLFEIANGLGVRVILDGYDGDTTVSHGLAYLRDLIAAGNLEAFYDENEKWLKIFHDDLTYKHRFLADQTISILKIFARRNKWTTVFRTIRQMNKRGYSRTKIARAVLRDEAPDVLKKAWYGLRGTRPEASQLDYIHPDFASRIHLDAIRRAENQTDPETSLNEREHHRRRMNLAIMSYTLELMNTFAAAWQLEVRSPFLDKRLIEFSMALPPTQKFNQGWTRMILRRAMEGILPPEVQWRRRKAGLSHNFKRVLFAYELETLEAIAMGKVEPLNQYIDLPQLRRILKEYESGNADQGIFVWRTVSLAVWLKRHMIVEKW